jgi:hypothetical protein
MYNLGQHFSSSFLFFFVGVVVPLEKEKMSEQAGRTDRRVNCSHAHTDSIVLLLFISQMTRRKNKKNRWTCIIHICKYIYLLRLAADQQYVQTRSGGKIVQWREQAVGGGEKK